MVRSAVSGFVVAAVVLADGFTFNIGNPVASGDYRSKTALFVFRTEGCADPAKAQIGATAEGLVKGIRQSAPLNLAKLSQPGVYGVSRTWTADGAWVVSLSRTCGERECRRDCPDRARWLYPRLIEIPGALAD